jgi:hypothetical protein
MICGTWWRTLKATTRKETLLTLSLRHCAIRQKVARLIPDGDIGIFHWLNPSSHTMALGMTQPLTEMSTRNGRDSDNKQTCACTHMRTHTHTHTHTHKESTGISYTYYFALKKESCLITHINKMYKYVFIGISSFAVLVLNLTIPFPYWNNQSDSHTVLGDGVWFPRRLPFLMGSVDQTLITEIIGKQTDYNWHCKLTNLCSKHSEWLFIKILIINFICYTPCISQVN